MTRLLVMISYTCQSLIALLLIFALSHVLDAPAYTAFSLTLASSQFFCSLAFDWVHLAGLRLLPSADPERGQDLRSALFTAEALSAGTLFCLALISLLLPGADGLLIIAGLAIAIAQGLGDLHFMMIRVSGRLALAAALLLTRAVSMLGAGLAAALTFGTASATLTGLLAGHVIGLLVASCLDPSLRHSARGAVKRADLVSFARYGMMAAGASTIHSAVPVAIRFLITGVVGSASAAAAAFSLAFDLMQRPFNVLVSAIHIVSYPDTIVKFDRDPGERAKASVSHMLEFIICSTAVMLAGLIAFLPDISRLVVPKALTTDFLLLGPLAGIFYFLHTHVQATFALVPHLQRRASWLVLIATAQLALVGVSVLIAARLGYPTADLLIVSAVATLAVALIASGPTIQYGALPRPLLVAMAVIGAAAISLSGTSPSESVLWLSAKIALSLLVVSAVLLRGNFLAVRRDS